MPTVTTTSIKKLMYQNIKSYIVAQHPDPTSNRPATSSWVTLAGGNVLPYAPQVVISIEGGAGDQTGINNNMETHNFGVLIHHTTSINLIELADAIYNKLKRDIGDFFSAAGMYRPRDFIQPYTTFPHEINQGEMYAKFMIKFDFLHFDD